MTEEQKKARKESAESGHIRWIKDNCLRTKDGKDDYVFISYKSDDYEKVLDGILYNTCKKYGLKVYFDTAFDDDSPSWINQYYENMCDTKCKAFIAFVDDAYFSSYACLLEMMSRKTAAAGGDYKWDSLPFLSVDIGAITDIKSSANTGLGTRRYSNGKINKHAAEELERFNEIFSEVADYDPFMRKSIYKRENDSQLYEEATADENEYGKMYLNVTQCRRLMERVIPSTNENDGSNKSFVEVIHDKLLNKKLASVFGAVSKEEEVKPEEPKDGTTKQEESTTPVKPQPEPPVVVDPEPGMHRITVEAFLKKYDYKTFKSKTFATIRLVGPGEYARYGTDTFESANDLVWEFVKRRLEEQGKAYIDFVNSKYETKNPVFITAKEHEERKARKDNVFYKKLDVTGLEGYSMNCHYSVYNWVADPLKKRLQELELPLTQMEFEYTWGTEAANEASEEGKVDTSVKPESEQSKTTGEKRGITGPVSLSGSDKKAPAGRVSGEFTLAEFVKKFDGNTFQSSSCDRIKLVGHNGYEHLSLGPCGSARELVITFMQKRLEEQGMKYIETVNASYESKNPLFIPVEEHRERKRQKSNVQYMEIDSPAGKGYSFNTHYSEYNWLKDSLMKQLRALDVSAEDLTLILS